MRKAVFDKWGMALAIVFFIPSIVQAEIKNSFTVSRGFENRAFESRYVSAKIGPEKSQTDLLKSIVERQVPTQITTVGAALSYLLRPYGFQIDDSPELDEQYLLLVLALPDPHRTMGPMTLMDALIILGGKSFQPLINPVKRTVAYQLRDGFGQFVIDEDLKVAKQQWLKPVEKVSLSTSELKSVEIEQPTYGPVRRGDSLSRIASQIDVKGMTLDQTLVYLFVSNPHAFANSNMNHLLAGTILTIPSVDIETLPTAVESNLLVDEHYRLWRQREEMP